MLEGAETLINNLVTTWNYLDITCYTLRKELEVNGAAVAEMIGAAVAATNGVAVAATNGAAVASPKDEGN